MKAQIWYLFIPPRDFGHLSQTQKIEVSATAVRYIAEKAAQIGCSVGLYNHGGWFGEPENELAILDQLKMHNIGMVYNGIINENTDPDAETGLRKNMEGLQKILGTLGDESALKTY